MFDADCVRDGHRKHELEILRFTSPCVIIYYTYNYIHQLLTTPSYVYFVRRVSVTIPPSSGAIVHYERPWFIFIVGFSLISEKQLVNIDVCMNWKY